MKKILFIFIMILCVFLFAGCTTHYSRNDIIKYVKKEIGISKFTVPLSCEKIKDSNGFTDKLWTIKDTKNDITFHVFDNCRNTSLAVSNALFNDYDNSLFVKLYEEIEKEYNVKLFKDDSSELLKVELLCDYKNKDQLDACYNEIVSYKEQLEKLGYSLKINCRFRYDLGIKKFDEDVLSYTLLDGNNISYEYLSEISKETYDKVFNDFVSCALIYQIEEALVEINYLDKQLVMNHPDTHRIFRKTPSGRIDYYDDVLANYSYGISFGGLYKILLEEKYDVKGNAWHYTVKYNNDLYEFSYDFDDMLYEDKDGDNYGYYYIKNGEKQKMKYYFYNCFRDIEINKMFNLDINESANRVINKI